MVLMNSFIEDIHSKAKQQIKRIAFDEVDDERVLKAAQKIKELGIAQPVLVGSAGEIEKNASVCGASLEGVEIIDGKSFEDFDSLVELLMQIRRSKGMTEQQAREVLENPIYFAMMLLKTDRIDGIVSGAAHPTAHILRPALQIIKTAEGLKTASSYFLMSKGDEQLFFADCALNIQPTVEQLADIACSTAGSVSALGITPRVAMLSFSTKGSASHPDADKVIEATKLLESSYPELAVDGELQFDAAYVKKVADKKCPDSSVAGCANVFVFPDLDAANIGYKIAQRLGGYDAIGPIVQGLNKPVNDLSRGCSVDDIVNLTSITAVNAQ